jgi:class 3 adenylate cyclase
MPSRSPFPLLQRATLNSLRAHKTRARRSLLCSDIVGFTTMLSRLGDARALSIVRRHDAIVWGCAAAHEGNVLELRGDGFLVSFERRDCALDCAIDIQRELAADRDHHDDGGVRVRIGVHTGDMLVERGRYFGLEVVVPFRLLEVAAADEILASDATQEEQPTVAIRGTRELLLDGIPRPVQTLEVDWQVPLCTPTPETLAEAAALACQHA